MTVAELLNLIQTLGVPVAIIIALAWFFASRIWPLVLDRIKKADEGLEKLREERRVERAEWLAALAKHDGEIARAFNDLGDTLKRSFEERDSRLMVSLAQRDDKLFEGFRKVLYDIAPKGEK